MRWLLSSALLACSPAAAQHVGPAAPLATGEHHAIIDGVRLWYRVAGPARGEPVVFLHGGPGQGSQAFATLAGPALERSLRMVYLDQRGSGRSERPWTSDYALDRLVDDIEALRQTLGVQRIALIGQSFGTILALEYAAKYPDRVSRVILAAAVPDIPATARPTCARLKTIDPAAYARATAGFAADADPPCQPSKAYQGKDREAFYTANMYPDPRTATLVNGADGADGLRNTGEIGRALFGAGLMTYRFDKHARVTAPVLVIAGAADYQASIEPQRVLARELPNARIVEQAGRGHFMFAEDPEGFAREVTSFLGVRK